MYKNKKRKKSLGRRGFEPLRLAPYDLESYSLNQARTSALVTSPPYTYIFILLYKPPFHCRPGSAVGAPKQNHQTVKKLMHKPIPRM